MPTVSVIIPAFNAAAFIQGAVRSALGQSLPPHEVIVVDDGSSDGTLGVIGQFGGSITVLQQKNGGAARARNAGARAASGEWLAFLDADDEWKPTKLATQAQRMTDDVALLYTDRFNCGDRGSLPSRAGMGQDIVAGETLWGLLHENVITTSSVVLRRSVFDSVGGFTEDPQIAPAEDWDLWLRIAGLYQIRSCAEPLVDYRIHKNSESVRDLRMNRARIVVIERALASPACRQFGVIDRRRIRSKSWLQNAFDARRAGAHAQAINCSMKALELYPFQWSAWRELARSVIHRL